jgi:hypothetical protein
VLTNLQLYMKFEDEQNPEWRESNIWWTWKSTWIFQK